MTASKRLRSICAKSLIKGWGMGLRWGVNRACCPTSVSTIWVNWGSSRRARTLGQSASRPVAPPCRLKMRSGMTSISSGVCGQALEFTVSGRLKRDAIQTLAKLFKQQLETLIQETVHAPRSYLTPSDIEDLLSVRELDRLQENSEIEGVYLA